MPLPRLLIADCDEEFARMLEDTLSGHFAVRTCGNGIRAWELVESFQPSVLLLELMLPGLDGISLLHKLRQSSHKPGVLVLTSLQTAYTRRTLQQLQVDYMMLKPCDLQALSLHLETLAAALQPTALPMPDPRQRTAQILRALGFSPKVSGFHYLQLAIPMYAADPRQAITKELYTAIGQQCGKNAQLVERAIRAAIDTAWRHRDEQLWRQYCRTAPDGAVPRPSNGDLIAALAQLLEGEIREEKGA